MEEFIENFQNFRDWLYETESCSEFNSEDERVLNKVVKKFEDLGLHDCF